VVIRIETLVFSEKDRTRDKYTVEYARTNLIGSRTSFDIASVRSSIH
jgi:hypothetical protein